MTAQCPCSFIFKGKEYSEIIKTQPMAFDPREYDIVPQSRCTACYRGYWCDYAINDDGMLELCNLYINSKDGEYPSIMGVSVSDMEYTECVSINIDDGSISNELEEKYMGHHRYENIKLPINYTGKILLGNGFDGQYYIHGGYQHSWAYSEVIEMDFKRGKLLQIIDYSSIAKDMGDKVENMERFSRLNPKEIKRYLKSKGGKKISTTWWLESEINSLCSARFWRL